LEVETGIEFPDKMGPKQVSVGLQGSYGNLASVGPFACALQEIFRKAINSPLV